MPDQTPQPPPPAEPGPTINIGEEFGTAKRNLPPAKIVIIAIAALAVVAAIFILVKRRPDSRGSIDDVTAVEVPGQNSMLVAINVTLQNNGKKPLWIHNMQATLKTADNQYSDDAASPVDFDRYFQAFPALKAHALAPLAVETKIPPGAQAQGTIVVSFPVAQYVFSDKRNVVSVTIQPYDELPLVISR